MKTHNLQKALVGLILAFAVILPSTVSAQHNKRDNRQIERKHKQNNRRPAAQHKYVKKGRYKSVNYKKPYYNKRVYKAGYKQHAHQIPNYYPTQNKGVYKTVFTFLPAKAQVIHLNGCRYYHYNKAYFRHHPAGGYVMVRPPKYIQAIPRTSIKVNYNGRVAYRYGGVYFSWTPYGYIVL